MPRPGDSEGARRATADHRQSESGPPLGPSPKEDAGEDGVVAGGESDGDGARARQPGTGTATSESDGALRSNRPFPSRTSCPYLGEARLWRASLAKDHALPGRIVSGECAAESCRTDQLPAMFKDTLPSVAERERFELSMGQ